MIKKFVAPLALVAAVSMAPAAFAQDAAEPVDHAAAVEALGGDAKKGKRVFNKCRSCHQFKNAKSRPTGPHHVGLIGRPAGILDDYKYSDANKNSGLVWDVPTLKEYLAVKTSDFMPGTKMNFVGLKKEEDIDNLITYLFEEAGVWEGETPTN